MADRLTWARAVWHQDLYNTCFAFKQRMNKGQLVKFGTINSTWQHKEGHLQGRECVQGPLKPVWDYSSIHCGGLQQTPHNFQQKTIKYLNTCSGAKEIRSSKQAQLFFSSSPYTLTKNREPEEYMLEGKVLFYQEKIKAVVSKYNTSNACIKDIIVSSVRFLVTNELAPPLSSDICVSNALSSS